MTMGANDDPIQAVARYIMDDLGNREMLGNKNKLAKYLVAELEADHHEALRVAKEILMDKQQGYIFYPTANELAELLSEKFG